MKQASLQKMFPRPGETTPEIRFDGFTEPWKMKSISQILTIGNGCDYKHLSKGIIPVFGTGGIMTHVSKCLYDGESVFIGRKGTIDKPLYFNGKFWTVDTLFYTHSFVDAVPYFVYCLFQKINWQSYNAATGVPSLSKDVINTIEVTIPLPDEQKAIANYFRNLDAIISAKRKKLEKLQNLKQSCLDKMFVNTTAQ